MNPDIEARTIAAGKTAIRVLTVVWGPDHVDDIGPLTREAGIDGEEHLEAVMVARLARRVLAEADAAGCTHREALRRFALRHA